MEYKTWRIPVDVKIVEGEIANSEISLDAEQFARLVVDDAARFREIESILRDWLAEQDIFIVQVIGGSYMVAGMRKEIEWFERVYASTYAEALAIALRKVYIATPPDSAERGA